MGMNNKVFVITKGDYSDYHICTVTMDRSRAENLKKLFDDRYDKAMIEEYILEEAKENWNVYYVEFPDGESPTIHLCEYQNFDFGPLPSVSEWEEQICVYVRSKDEKHAMKIAQDEYAKWKAEKEGVV